MLKKLHCKISYMDTRKAIMSDKAGCQNFLLWMNACYEQQYTGLFNYAPTECIVLRRYHMTSIQREKPSYLTHIT
jgi:hypothetical protein